MKKLNEILFITEETDTNKWYVSFNRPAFQAGETEEVSKEDAVALLKIINNRFFSREKI